MQTVCMPSPPHPPQCEPMRRFALGTWAACLDSHAPGPKQLRTVIAAEQQRITSSIAVLPDCQDDATTLGDLLPSSSPAGPPELQVELLSQLPSSVGGRHPSGGGAGEDTAQGRERGVAVQGRIRLGGVVAGVVLVHRRESAAVAAQLLKVHTWGGLDGSSYLRA